LFIGVRNLYLAIERVLGGNIFSVLEDKGAFA
jgi:hypothetical protein